jgi:hypothetical protein
MPATSLACASKFISQSFLSTLGLWRLKRAKLAISERRSCSKHTLTNERQTRPCGRCGVHVVCRRAEG